MTLGGEALSLVPVGSGANYTEYAADVHALAGQTAELDFTVFAYPQQFAADYLFLDSIRFSPVAIPEPGVFGLWALGVLLVGGGVVGGGEKLCDQCVEFSETHLKPQMTQISQKKRREFLSVQSVQSVALLHPALMEQGI